MNDFLFVALVVIAALGAISVVLCRKVVHMAASLIVALSSVAGLFFSMGANFVGATQLMVYVGGTVILLIFGVMLTSMHAKAELKTTPVEVIVALASGAVLLLICSFTVGAVEWKSHFAGLSESYLKVADARYQTDVASFASQSEIVAQAKTKVAEAKAKAELESVNATSEKGESQATKDADQKLRDAEADLAAAVQPIQQIESKANVSGSELLAAAQQLVAATKVNQAPAIESARQQLSHANEQVARLARGVQEGAENTHEASGGDLAASQKAVAEAQKQLVAAQTPIDAAELKLALVKRQLADPKAKDATASHVELAEEKSSFKSLALALAGIRTDSLAANAYLLPFEIVSFHLLVVLVAAGYLARPKSSQHEQESAAE